MGSIGEKFRVVSWRTWLGWGAAAFAAAWFAVHVGWYAKCVWPLDWTLSRSIRGVLHHSLGWQALGFFALLGFVATWRPSLMGKAFGLFILASTAALLACSRDAAMIGRFALLTLWMLCAANTIRPALAKTFGPTQATWGVAAAAVFAAFIPISFALGLLHAIRPWVVGCLAIAWALPGAIHLVRSCRKNVEAIVQWFDRLGIIDASLLEMIWLVLAIGFVGASTSEVRSDAVRVHLPYVHRVVADEGISHQYACWHRLQPMAAQTSYALFASVGGDGVAKWYSWFALAALVLLVGEEVARRSNSLRLGLFAGAALLGCPLLVWLSTTLYIDHIVVLLCTAGFITLFRAFNPPSLRGILFSAAMMGSMAQVKYTGLLFCAVWSIWVCVGLLRQCDWQVAVRWAFLAGLVLIVTASPWFLYVYHGAGNPFYPYLNRWFPSPYWPEGLTMREIFEQTFRLSPGVRGAAAFPWTATYETTRYSEADNGAIGFWILALAACWFAAIRSRTSALYGDMAVAGALMVAGIVVYTPYIRYWLPAAPLLVSSCVLAAGTMIASFAGWIKTPKREFIFGMLLAGLCVLPMPITGMNLPWDQYAKHISERQQLAAQFQEYEAVEQLNAILSPDDGVLCTGCNGVYLVNGRAYEFAFWWNRIHKINDVASFEDFCRRNGIRYWIVNHFAMMSKAHFGSEPIVDKYWTDARLVTGCGTVDVYDVTPDGALSRGKIVRRTMPAKVEATQKPWSPLEKSKHWVPLLANDAPKRLDGAILLDKQDRIGHQLLFNPNSGLCKVECRVWSENTANPLMEIAWYDADNRLLRRVEGGAQGKSDYSLSICSPIPEGAVTGWVQVREWKGLPLRIKGATATYWESGRATETAQRRAASPQR